MSHIPSESDIDCRAEQLNPTSLQYCRDRGYSHQNATALATITQPRYQIEASHLKQMQKRERD